MRALYEADITGDDLIEIAELNLGRFRFTEDGRAYADGLIAECAAHRARIDEAIRTFLENWRLERVGAIERAILRLSTAELIFQRETPVQVVLDEALRLAHRYGDDAMTSFVNGILDSVARQERPGECTR